MRRNAASLLAPILLLLAPSAWATPATGNPVVYVSPNGSGTPPATSPYVLLPLDGQPLYLFLDYQNDGDADPSTTGTMCVDANGDETCAFDVLLTMQSDAAVFASFTPASSAIVGRIDPGTQKTLRVNGIDVNGMAIPAAIGTLVVDADGTRQLQIQVAGRHRVGAGGQLDAIQSQVIVNLPEPGREWLLASGLLGLALLACLRRRRLAAGA
jgi:hypothetical protein